jgi:hypothetical protein
MHGRNRSEITYQFQCRRQALSGEAQSGQRHDQYSYIWNGDTNFNIVCFQGREKQLIIQQDCQIVVTMKDQTWNNGFG